MDNNERESVKSHIGQYCITGDCNWGAVFDGGDTSDQRTTSSFSKSGISHTRTHARTQHVSCLLALSVAHTHTYTLTPPTVTALWSFCSHAPAANGAGPALPLSRLPVATRSRYNGSKGQKVASAETRPSVEAAIEVAQPLPPHTHTLLYIASMHPKAVTDYLADLKVTLNNIEKKILLLKWCSLKKKIKKEEKLSLAHKIKAQRPHVEGTTPGAQLSIQWCPYMFSSQVIQWSAHQFKAFLPCSGYVLTTCYRLLFSKTKSCFDQCFFCLFLLNFFVT